MATIQTIAARLKRLEQSIAERDAPDLAAFGETLTVEELTRFIEYSRQHPGDRKGLVLSQDPTDMKTTEILRILRPSIEAFRRESA